jgi:NADH-quinone oxidoreductase subunit H
LAGTLDVVKIAQQQAGGILHWNILGGGALSGLDKWIVAGGSNNPQAAQILQMAYPDGWWSGVAAIALVLSTIVLFFLYITGACAEINRIPFDLPEAESELVSGYNTEYSGIKFAIFFLAEFTNLFIVSTIAVVMFLGAGGSPLPPAAEAALGLPQLGQAIMPHLTFLTDTLQILNPIYFWAAFWVIVKTYMLVFFAILVRGTLPRFRIDQLMDFGWKRLIPIALIVFLIVTFAREAVFHV